MTNNRAQLMMCVSYNEDNQNKQEHWIMLSHDRYTHQHDFYRSKARAQFECRQICKADTFEIAKLRTKGNRTHLASTKYYLKYKELGLAKCRSCDYITANPVKFGGTCPCCRSRFSRFIKNKNAGVNKPR